MNPIVDVFPDHEALMDAAAACVVALAQESITARGRFTWALSGGTTPRDLHSRVARAPLDWSKVIFFWGDERCVPPGDPDSNYGMAKATILDRIAVAPQNVHRMRGEDEPEIGAAAYDKLLRDFFALEGAPRFDLNLLGMGADGHTASLFPGTPALRETARWCVANEGPSWRITLTLPAIGAAANLLMLVEHAVKAPAVRDVLEHRDPIRPATHVVPANGTMRWMLDAEAASLLAKT